MRTGKGLRVTAGAAAVVLVLVATSVIVYRVFAPTQVVTPARGDYPPAVSAPPGVRGTLNAAPLIVDDRLRIFAADRQVTADEPADAETRRTPYWSYRRWPAEVTGVVAAGGVVASRWSDGRLVGLDWRTGQVRWQVDGPGREGGYEARRTGAAVVYSPPGMHVASPAGDPVVLVAGGDDELRGFDIATGRQLWRAESPARCRGASLTTTDGTLRTVEGCGADRVLVARDPLTGRPVDRWRPSGGDPARLVVTGLGCAPAASACPGMRTDSGGRTRGWLVRQPGGQGSADTGLTPAPALDDPASRLVDGVALSRSGATVTAREPSSGTVRWRWSDPALDQILPGQSGRVHLVTTDRALVTLDPATGELLSRFPLTYRRDPTSWAIGHVHAAAGLVALERVREPVDETIGDEHYFVAPAPVILAAT